MFSIYDTDATIEVKRISRNVLRVFDNKDWLAVYVQLINIPPGKSARFYNTC